MRSFNRVLTAYMRYTRTPRFRSVTLATNQRACKWTDDPACTINVDYLNTCRSRVLTSARPLRLINVWLKSRLWSLCHSDLEGSRHGWKVIRRIIITLHYDPRHFDPQFKDSFRYGLRPLGLHASRFRSEVTTLDIRSLDFDVLIILSGFYGTQSLQFRSS